MPRFQSRNSRLLLALLWVPCLLWAFYLDAHALAIEPAASAPAEAEIAVLHLREEVDLSSAIVRLADVVTPVGDPPQGWQRAAAASIALLPTDGRRLRIERQRLSEMLQRSNLLTARVRWSGPETVSVRYAPAMASAAAKRSMVQPASEVAPVTEISTDAAADRGVATAELEVATADQPIVSEEPGGQTLALPPAERNRIRRMIQVAFERTHEDLSHRSELVIDETPGNLSTLDGLRAIRSMRITGKVGEKPILLAVDGDTMLERVHASVRAELHELPLAVVATHALNRGEIITAQDVRLQPMPRDRQQENGIREIASVLGMEVKRPLSEGRVIEMNDITRPIVIRRGDLVEVRVVGAGVTIATAGRAQQSAAAGEPVTVETQSPRRRLIGHAVAGGVVEIVTRPPTSASRMQ